MGMSYSLSTVEAAVLHACITLLLWRRLRFSFAIESHGRIRYCV